MIQERLQKLQKKQSIVNYYSRKLQQRTGSELPACKISDSVRRNRPDSILSIKNDEKDIYSIKSHKQFLKRRTKRIEPTKVDWKGINRKIDCWNQKNKRSLSHKEPSQVVLKRIVGKPPIDKKLNAEKNINENIQKSKVKKVTINLSRRERMTIPNLIREYNSIPDNKNNIKDYLEAHDEKESIIPTLHSNSQFFEQNLNKYKVK